MKKLLPEREYLESLPKKRMGAGVLLFYDGKLLLLKSAHRDHWLLPGGKIDQNESPVAAAVRELKEELGLELEIKRLLAVDYTHEVGEKTESVQFVFDGGTLSEAQFKAIRLQEAEVTEARLFPLDEAPRQMSKLTSQRVTSVLRAEAPFIYLENGFPALP